MPDVPVLLARHSRGTQVEDQARRIVGEAPVPFDEVGGELIVGLEPPERWAREEKELAALLAQSFEVLDRG